MAIGLIVRMEIVLSLALLAMKVGEFFHSEPCAVWTAERDTAC